MEPVASNHMMELHVASHEEQFKRKGTLIIHQRQIPDARAAFAMQIIERFALAAAAPDGEDSAGRQRLRLQEPDEIVAFACDIAEQAFHEFEDRDWILDAPSYADIGKLPDDGKPAEV